MESTVTFSKLLTRRSILRCWDVMGRGGYNGGGGSLCEVVAENSCWCGVIGKQHFIRNLFLGQSAERTIMSSSREGKMYNALSPLFIPRMRGRPVSVGHPRRGHRSPVCVRSPRICFTSQNSGWIYDTGNNNRWNADALKITHLNAKAALEKGFYCTW